MHAPFRGYTERSVSTANNVFVSSEREGKNDSDEDEIYHGYSLSQSSHCTCATYVNTIFSIEYSSKIDVINCLLLPLLHDEFRDEHSRIQRVGMSNCVFTRGRAHAAVDVGSREGVREARPKHQRRSTRVHNNLFRALLLRTTAVGQWRSSARGYATGTSVITSSRGRPPFANERRDDDAR